MSAMEFIALQQRCSKLEESVVFLEQQITDMSVTIQQLEARVTAKVTEAEQLQNMLRQEKGGRR